MTALRSTDRIEALNQRANDIYGEVLHGRATSADIVEFERTVAELQAALVGDDEMVSIDHAGVDMWLNSPAARDYLADSEE